MGRGQVGVGQDFQFAFAFQVILDFGTSRIKGDTAMAEVCAVIASTAAIKPMRYFRMFSLSDVRSIAHGTAMCELTY